MVGTWLSETSASPAVAQWLSICHGPEGVVPLQVLKVRIATATLPRERIESLAYFTSIGPTPDGRIKPDIVAPGTTISAHQCGTLSVAHVDT